MAKICLVRIDFRLIHGQVVTKWLKQLNANRILVINDNLAKDPYMSKIYAMAAPANVACSIINVDQFIALWEKNRLGDGNVLILFKDVFTAAQVWREGFPVEKIQIGGLGAGPGRKAVYQNMTLNQEDAKLLQEMHDGGVAVIFQAIPEDKAMEYEKVMDKVSF